MVPSPPEVDLAAVNHAAANPRLISGERSGRPGPSRVVRWSELHEGAEIVGVMVTRRSGEVVFSDFRSPELYGGPLKVEEVGIDGSMVLRQADGMHLSYSEPAHVWPAVITEHDHRPGAWCDWCGERQTMACPDHGDVIPEFAAAPDYAPFCPESGCHWFLDG